MISPAWPEPWSMRLAIRSRGRAYGRSPVDIDILSKRSSGLRRRDRNPLRGGDSLRPSEGNFVTGVYPLLPEETCWLRAADLDEECWAAMLLPMRSSDRPENGLRLLRVVSFQRPPQSDNFALQPAESID